MKLALRARNFIWHSKLPSTISRRCSSAPAVYMGGKVIVHSYEGIKVENIICGEYLDLKRGSNIRKGSIYIYTLTNKYILILI
jgi:hypothetical protein